MILSPLHLKGIATLDVKPTRGIYFLLKDDVVYVGQSADIAMRARAHAREKQFDKVCYLEISDPGVDLLRIESAFIRYFNPPLNNGIISCSDASEDNRILSVFMGNGAIGDLDTWQWRFSRAWKDIARHVEGSASVFSFSDQALRDAICAIRRLNASLATRMESVIALNCPSASLAELAAHPRPRKFWKNWGPQCERTLLQYLQAQRQA